MTSIARQAIVIGAGMGGLSAAAAVAPFFDRVTVLERDALPSEPAWRIGTPQCSHIHALLLGGLEALGELVPGLSEDLERAGAVPFNTTRDAWYEFPNLPPLVRDVGLPSAYSMTRPLLEHTVRRRIESLGNVEIRDRRRVHSLTSAGNRVTGVRIGGDPGEALAADLVIDCSGRGAPTLDLLRELGQTPEEDVVGCNLSYATVLVAKPDGWVDDWLGVTTFAGPPDDHKGSFVYSVENRCWMATLNEMHGEDPPETWETFLAAAKTLHTPTFYDAVSAGRPMSDVMRFRRPTSTLRHFERLAAFPQGLIALGDVICQFNPVYGQGMTVAAQEARLLRRLLVDRSTKPHPLAGLAEAFFAATPQITQFPWAYSNGYDFAFPETTGSRPPVDAAAAAFSAALTELVRRDADVHRLLMEVNFCLKPPTVYQDPALMARVMSVAAELRATA